MKKPIASILLGVLAVRALGAGTDATAVDRLVACTGLQDSLQRLVCFDREIAPFAKARTAAPPAASIAQPAPPPAASIAPPAPPVTQSFGAEQLSAKSKAASQEREEEEPALHARISGLRATGANAYVVTLDNGQAWRHEDEHLGSYLREGEAVTIRKAALGSYRLTRDAGEAKNWIRVRRIR